VIRADQLSELDPSPDFLETLTSRGRRRVLVVVDESARQTPQAATRLDRTTPEHDAASGFHHHGRGHLRIVPQDKRVVWADLVLATFDELRDERRTAIDAEVTGHVRGA